MTNPQPQGFLAAPTTGEGPGVLVLHAWWGLNDTIRAFCDRLAAEGFVVFAPDLYHGKVVDTIPDAEAAVKALESSEGGFQQAQADVAAGAMFLSEQSNGRGLAVIGFSMGVPYALGLASAAPRWRSAAASTGTRPFSRSITPAATAGRSSAVVARAISLRSSFSRLRVCRSRTRPALSMASAATRQTAAIMSISSGA